MYQRTSYQLGPGRITPAVKNLIIANVIVFFLTIPFRRLLFTYGALYPPMVMHGMVWQLITYQFLHAGFWHIFWNMFILYMFGVEMEETWGTRPFLTFYLICGVGAGFFQMIFAYTIPAVGASGAIYGVLIAYGLTFPNRMLTLLLFFVLPVTLRAIHLVLFLIITTLFFAASGQGGQVAHFAHLGGIVFGYLCMKYNWHYFDFTAPFARIRQRSKSNMARKKKLRLVKLEYDVDSLLDKISESGYESLTREEKRFLETAGDDLDKYTP